MPADVRSKTKRAFAAPRLIWELVIQPLSTAGRVVAGLVALGTVVLPALLEALGWPWSVSVLLGIILALSLIALHRIQTTGPQAHVTWSEEKTFVPLLCVTNLGDAALFSAKLELLEVRNFPQTKPKPSLPTFYLPAWNETDELALKILKGDSRYLLLAKTEPLTKGSEVVGASLGFYRLTRKGREWERDWIWRTPENGQSPVFVVRVWVFSEPAAHAHFKRDFEIECLWTGCKLRAINIQV